MNNATKFLISVLPREFDENVIQYSDAVTWSRSNTSHHNVVELSIDDICEMEYVWDIINAINNSMIGPYEDSWVPDQVDRIRILDQLKNFDSNKLSRKHGALLNEIIRLFQMAVESNHNIYFIF